MYCCSCKYAGGRLTERLRAICHSAGWHAVGSLKSSGREMDILSAFEAWALIIIIIIKQEF
jgi:hypothetical protein